MILNHGHSQAGTVGVEDSKLVSFFSPRKSIHYPAGKMNYTTTTMPLATNTVESPAYSVRPESTWDLSIMSLEKHMEVYRQASLKGDQSEMEQAAENITLAMREAVNAQPVPEVESKSEKKSKDKFKSRLAKMRFPGADTEKESPGRQITRGLLTILTTPIAFVGMGIYAIGILVEGTGTMLKGAGSLGRKAFVPPRKSSEDRG